MEAILAITDGVNRIDLLNYKNTGIHVTDWRPRQPDIEATIRQSPYTDGGKPVQWRFTNATETFEHNVDELSTDDLIQTIQDTRRLLIQGINYHISSWLQRPVYLEAKGRLEANTRYALIKFYQLPDDSFPYSDPFLPDNIKGTPLSDNMALILERGHWLSNPPGSGECVEVSSTQDWLYQAAYEIVTTDATNSWWSVIETSAGTIIAGHRNKVRRSTNGGSSWSDVTLTSATNVYDLLELDTGRILAVTQSGTVYRSDNDGASFGSTALGGVGETYSIAQSSTTGTVMIGGFSGLSRSTNRGTSFTAVSGLTPTGTFTGLVYAFGKFFASDQVHVWRSDDDGLTWSLNYDAGTGSNGSRIVVLDDGTVLAAFVDVDTSGHIQFVKLTGVTGERWFTYSTYTPVTPSALSYLFGKFARSGNTIYFPVYLTVRGLGDEQIIRSEDSGKNWLVERESSSDSVYGMLVDSDGAVYAGETGDLLKKSGVSVTLGKADDCDGEVYVANKQNYANITHIKVYDASGTSYTDIFPITSYPQNLLPATPAVGDIVYFGSDTGTISNAGVFSSLVFDLVPITLTQSYTIVWEAYTGSWTTLTVTDNTGGNGGVFSNEGVCSIHFRPPSTWATTDIDGVTGYWIRARLTALSGSITPPKQQNRNIYSVNRNYFEIDDGDVGGDIPALARIKLVNQSDKNDQGDPDLWSNRIICGLRSTSRGENFVSYINLSDAQTVPGITVTENGSFDSSPRAATGRYISATTTTSWATDVTISFDATVVGDFYGTYHLYLIAEQIDGTAGDTQVRAQITSGSGGATFTTEPKTFLLVGGGFELVDLDAVNFPAIGVLASGEVGDVATIDLQLKSTVAGRTVQFYAVVLIPTDEWAGDFQDPANSSTSVLGTVGNVKRFIDIDSISLPRRVGRSVVKNVDLLGSIAANYEYGANGPVIWQNNATQRLYILSACYDGSSAWIARPDVSWSVQAYKNQRYLTMRGNR